MFKHIIIKTYWFNRFFSGPSSIINECNILNFALPVITQFQSDFSSVRKEKEIQITHFWHGDLIFGGCSVLNRHVNIFIGNIFCSGLKFNLGECLVTFCQHVFHFTRIDLYHTQQQVSVGSQCNRNLWINNGFNRFLQTQAGNGLLVQFLIPMRG